MITRSIVTSIHVILLCAAFCSPAVGDVPFPPFSSCTVTVTQYPPRPSCLDDFEPDVVRLTPAGSTASPLFDRVSVSVRVRGTDGSVIPNALVSFYETSGVVNIASGGATTALTDSEGAAVVTLHAGSGYGRVALCADGVQVCYIDVRSPDVARTTLPTGCVLSTVGSSFVSGVDLTHGICGFQSNFGPVTVGDNEMFDLSCDGVVNGWDVIGHLGKGGALQYFGDGGVLGAKNQCPVP
jgi:hypothetical protein